MKSLGQQALPVLICLASDMMHFKKTRVWPGHTRIVKELKEKTSISRCTRTLMRWMARMESHGLIYRNKRHRFTAQNGWEFRSSLYGITVLGWNLLIRAGVYTRDEYNRLKGQAKSTFRRSKRTQKVFRPSGNLTHIGDFVKGLLFNTS